MGDLRHKPGKMLPYLYFIDCSLPLFTDRVAFEDCESQQPQLSGAFIFVAARLHSPYLRGI
jgi:hypothetical protein